MLEGVWLGPLFAGFEYLPSFPQDIVTRFGLPSVTHFSNSPQKLALVTFFPKPIGHRFALEGDRDATFVGSPEFF